MNVFSPFFKIDVDFEIDSKIVKLLSKEGNQGLGVYLRLVCLAYRDIIKADDIDVVAYYIGESEEYVRHILEDFGLFYKATNEEGVEHYTSKRIEFEIAEIERVSKKAKIAGKASAAARKRTPTTQDEVQDGLNSVIQASLECDDVVNEYNKIFNREYKVTKKVQSDIENLIENESLDGEPLNLKDFTQIFQNAKRGWKIKNEIKEPSFADIIKNWERFYNDDYYLAGESESTKSKRQAREQAEENAKIEENKKIEEERRIKESNYAKIKDRQAALDYLRIYYGRYPASILTLANEFKELSRKYNLSESEVINNE